MNQVDAHEWGLQGMRDESRRARLLNPPSPEELITIVAREAMEAALARRFDVRCQDGDNMKGCARARAAIPLCVPTFDLLFNGRSGYRAQYYLSESEGIEFNRLITTALCETARVAHDATPDARGWTFVEKSLQGSWTKIWVHGDRKPICGVDPNEFRPARWARDYPYVIWVRAPLPDAPALDLIGSWVEDETGSIRQDIVWKGDRAKRIYDQAGA
jgi:hypothetical protein